MKVGRIAVTLFAGYLLTACTDGLPSSGSVSLRADEAAAGANIPIVEFPDSSPTAISLEIQATGTTPSVVSRALARRGKGAHSLRLFLFGEDRPAGRQPPVRELGQQMGFDESNAVNAQSSLPVLEAGVYQLRATSLPIDSFRRRSESQLLSSAELWLVVDSGRVQTFATFKQLSARVNLKLRPVQFGAFGKFLKVPPAAALRVSSRPFNTMQSSGTVRTARFVYSLPGITSSLPVPAGVGVFVYCDWFTGLGTVFTDSDGRVTLPDAECGSFQVVLEFADQDVAVYSSDDIYASPAAMYGYLIPELGVTHIDVHAGESFPAAAFVRIRTAAARAVSTFGRTRARMAVYANSPGDTSIRTQYSPTTDRIQIDRSRAYSDDGEFVAVHEYGHAYHQKAIEPWASYSCVTPTNPTGQHEVDLPYTLSCAFVEGFADFFAAYLTYDKMTPGSTWSQAWFESAPTRVNAFGELIEGSFASFLLDLVDRSTDADGIPGDDDTMEFPGSFVESSMRQCDKSGSGAFSRTNGTDQIIYCAERVLNTARSFAPTSSQPNWRTFPASGLILGPLPPAYSQAKIRAAWRWNLYDTGALQ